MGYQKYGIRGVLLYYANCRGYYSTVVKCERNYDLEARVHWVPDCKVRQLLKKFRQLCSWDSGLVVRHVRGGVLGRWHTQIVLC